VSLSRDRVLNPTSSLDGNRGSCVAISLGFISEGRKMAWVRSAQHTVMMMMVEQDIARGLWVVTRLWRLLRMGSNAATTTATGCDCRWFFGYFPLHSGQTGGTFG
jgi:hypothetical protein